MLNRLGLADDNMDRHNGSADRKGPAVCLEVWQIDQEPASGDDNQWIRQSVIFDLEPTLGADNVYNPDRNHKGGKLPK